jgi:TonB family protein
VILPLPRFDYFGNVVFGDDVIYANRTKQVAHLVCGTLIACSLSAQFNSRPTGSISAPSIISKGQPEYTQRARAAGLEGEAVVRVRIDENGFPHEVAFVEFTSSRKHVEDPLGLDEKAVEAVKLWRFRPAKKNGTPVSLVVSVYVQFNLPPSERRNDR